MIPHTVRTESAESTRALAAQLGALLRGGDILCLTGDLGAGKTAFTQGLGIGLSLAKDDPISSPTFTLLSEHRSGAIPVYHFDVYRLNDASGLYDLAFDEYLDGSGVVVIEWADRVTAALPPDRLEIAFEFGEAEEERVLEFRALGERAEEILKGMRGLNAIRNVAAF